MGRGGGGGVGRSAMTGGGESLVVDGVMEDFWTGHLTGQGEGSVTAAWKQLPVLTQLP